MTKIFVRERGQVGKGEGLPRFAVVAVEGSGLKFFQQHLRKSEIEEIAKSVNAEVVILPRGTGMDAGQGSGGGKRKKLTAQKKSAK